MFEVLKIFYTTHYNFAAVGVLLLLLLIFLLSKKNYKASLIFLVVLIAMNMFIYKRTEGKAWTIYIDPPAEANNGYSYGDPEPIKMTFSAHKNWTITDNKGEVHHWCWVETYWDKVASTDVISAIWGTNSSKKMMKSSEEHMNITGD